MKKPPMETVELRFIGPLANMTCAIDALKPLGFRVVSDTMPWREVFPEYNDGDLPGACLRGGRYREGLTQQQLAERIGAPRHHISEMENGKRPIGKEMAKRLGKALNTDYKVFLQPK